MPSTSFHRIRQLFDSLVDLPPPQRDAYLAVQHDIDADTRQQLLGLLQSDAEMTGVTARPAVAAALQAAGGRSDRSGERIGAYVLQRELGSGGMGSVYLAERSEGDIVHQAAIKIVHAGLLDAATRARFDLERQVLALLRHPNIATLLDLGELDDGNPYVVIEYIDGMMLTDYARSRRLSLRQRLELLLSVCDAVAYAHRNMVVHRDLKPSNVLVDADGRAKLLDFGIAKPLVGHLGAINVEQTATAQRLFSPSHAAPEQLKGEAITTACDVYGLGTLLYELLADQPPFSTRDRTPGQLEREICELDPLPPSRRHAQNPDATAAVPSRDLDLIALRCLRKEPGNRYSSVEALAEDLRRYLHGLPINARRGNLGYRIGRFVARHRLVVSLCAVALTTALAGAVLLRNQRQATSEQRLRADEMTSLIIDALRSSDPSSKGARELSAREVFERVAAQAQSKPDLTPQSRAALLGAVARIDLELGLPKQAQNLVDQLDADLLGRAQREQTLLIQATVLVANKRFDEARVLIAAGLAGGGPQSEEWRVIDARMDFEQGKVNEALQKIDAMPETEIAPEMREARGYLRAQILLAQDKRDDARQEFVKLLVAQRARLGNDAPAVFDTLTRLVTTELRLGNYEAAEKLSEESFVLAEKLFGRNSLRYANALNAGHLLERARGNYAKALEYEKKVMEIGRDQLGAVSPNLAKSSFNIGGLYEKLENPAEAERYMREAIAMAERVWLPSDTNILLFRTALAAHLLVVQDRVLDAQQVVGPALRNADAHAQLKEFDTYHLALAIDRLGDYVARPSATTRAAAAKAMGVAATAGDGIAYRSAITQVLAKVRSMGVEPEPTAGEGSDAVPKR